MAEKSMGNITTRNNEVEDAPRRVSWHEFDRALYELRSQFCEGQHHVDICDMTGYGADAPIQLGVNWAALGTVQPEQTREFIALLEEALKKIEEFPYNGYVKDYKATR